MSAYLVLPLFYPFLLGHLPWAVAVPAFLLGPLLSYVAWRLRTKSRAAWILVAYGAVFSLACLWGRVCESAHRRFLVWHQGGAGLRAGMTRSEVLVHLKAHADKVDCYDEVCEYAPRGLAARAFVVMEVTGVKLEYGPDGKLVSWTPWRD